MIYLIDDKKTRQKDFGWTHEKFAQYASHLIPLYNINDIAKIGENLYNEGNIILYHESFLDFTSDRDKAVEQRNKLTEKASSINGLSVAFFSGSQSSRSLHMNVAHLPVTILYENLETLIQPYSQQNGDLKHLLFGENPEIEEKLSELLTQANRNIEEDAIELSSNTIFMHPDEDFIPNAILGGATEEIYHAEDKDLHEIIMESLSKIEFDNIFIPLCFGQILSDYNGLRLATHIRCTASPNQLKRIFIYSFVDIDYLLENEYFNILKTKNVQLVKYSKKAFEAAVYEGFTSLKKDELPQEINKLKLDSPLNYADSHSIANEWAIHQWAKTIGCDETDELAKVFQNIETNLYFKYLRTINPISEVDKISPQDLKIKFEGNPKVLLIDDEAEKGWGEVFAYIFNDVYQNDKAKAIYQDTLEIDFKKLSTEDLIQNSIQKIKDNDIDVVILDFRLNTSDFLGSNPKDFSSIRLLKKIKELNPGIQVIVFSATNKVWNLQALQDAGADGFLYKEGGENIYKAIYSFKDFISEAFSRIFLKEFYTLLFQVKNNIASCVYEDGTDFESFLKTLQSQLNIIDQAGRTVKTSPSISLDVVFLNCYNFLDLLRRQYIVENDFRFYIGIEESSLHRYDYNHGVFSDLGDFIKESHYDKPSWFQSMAGLLIDYFEVVGLNDNSIKDFWKVKNWRNAYIHEDRAPFSKSEVLKIVDLMVKITSSMKE